MSTATVQIEATLYEALRETELLAFQRVLAVEKQLTKVEHFEHVTDDELKSYGLSAPAVRRLRTALDRRKRAKKSKLFSKPKPTKYVKAELETPQQQSSSSLSTVDSAAAASNSASSSQPTATASTNIVNHKPSTSTSTLTSASNSTAPCLIARNDIQLQERLGEGTFAVVKRGVWQRITNSGGVGERIDCAVKILHQMSPAALEDLHLEIAQMQKLQHQHIVQLFGIVLGEPTMMIIEYCDGGSLLTRLRATKRSTLLVTKLLSYAMQIASGMAYLESKRTVHRDLAARNVLLTSNEDVAKICDFGLTRSLEENERLYVMSAQKKVPFAWCPVESLRFRQFSHKSDVWAFGVTCWELFSYGEEVWPRMSAIEVLRLTEAGQQLPMPKRCLPEIYAIMQMCWNLQPELRPKFSHLRNLLLDIKFMSAETREPYCSDELESLELSAGDHVIIITESENRHWFGQSVKSRSFGRFPFSLVSVKSSRIDTTTPSDGTISMTTATAAAATAAATAAAAAATTTPTPIASTSVAGATLTDFAPAPTAFSVAERAFISKPIFGSLIHTGHGDIDRDRSWGNVDKIDEIYLKNPVIKPTRSSGGGSDANRPRGVSFISSIASIHPDTISTSTSSTQRGLTTTTTTVGVSTTVMKHDDHDLFNAWNAPDPTPTATFDVAATSQMATSNPSSSLWASAAATVATTAPTSITMSSRIEQSKRDEYERLKAERLRAECERSTSTTLAPMYDTPTVDSHQQHAQTSGGLWSTSTSSHDRERRQTQPIAINTVARAAAAAAVGDPRRPSTASFDDDPFVVDPSLSQLSSSRPPITATMSARSMDTPSSSPIVVAMPTSTTTTTQRSQPPHQRPQSARVDSVHQQPAVVVAPLDSTLLALLDPLLASKQPSESSRVVKQSAAVAIPALAATATAAAAVVVSRESMLRPTTARPQNSNAAAVASTTTSHPTSAPSTARTVAIAPPIAAVAAATGQPRHGRKANAPPSALNVLAFVANGSTRHSTASTTTTAAATTKTGGSIESRPTTQLKPWTYLSPSTSPQPPISRAPATTSATSNLSKNATTTTTSMTTSATQRSSTAATATMTTISTSQPKTTTTTTTSSSSTSAVSSLLPPPSKLLLDGIKMSSVESNGVLPPPSKLLLEGSTSRSTTTTKNSAVDSAYSSLASRISTASIGDHLVAPIASQQQQPPQQQPPPPLPIVPSTQHIPFIMPTPLVRPSPTPVAAVVQPIKHPIISLQDLDIDDMLARVQNAAEFATREQCVHALKSTNYEVADAIQRLKIERLLETGLCNDRQTAARALHAAEWSLNEAAIRLVS